MAPWPRAPELLVFDWDGTLMDSVASIVACMQEAAREMGLPPLADADIRGTVGLGLKDSLGRLGIEADGDLASRLVERYRHHWFATYRSRCILFPGVAEGLAELRRQGYRLAVATGKSRRGLDRDLGETGLAPLFDATRTADEARPKPHPQMLLDILEATGVAAPTALMVGDTTFDLEMAAQAGMPAVGVLSGGHPREELDRCAPLVCLGSALEVGAWLAAAGAAPGAAAGGG